MFKKILLTLCIVLGVCYPFVIYAGIKLELIKYVLPLVAAVFLLRLVLSGRQQSEFKVLTCCSLITAAILCIGSAVFNNLRLVLYYPVFVNALFFAIFFLSLYKGDAVITRFAKLTQKEGQLPDFAISYTRKVTVVWSLFFIFNGLIALYTALSNDIDVWTLYNGLISYILIGCLMAIEFVIRIIIRKSHDS